MAKIDVSYELGWIGRIRELRRPMSRAECALWRELRGRRLLGFRFERQRAIERYIVSFYCPDLALAIEIDAPAGEDASYGYERERDVRLRLWGVAVLRFSEDEVLHNLDGVIAKIRQSIRYLPWRRTKV